MPPPTHQMSQNYEYIQGMMPYMNLQMIGNSMDEQKNIPMPEYYFGDQGNMINFRDFYSENNNTEFNKVQNDSPAKSTNEESKLMQKESSSNQEKTQEKNIIKDNYIDLLINSINHLFETGEITMEYINSKNHLKFDPQKLGLTLNTLSEDNDNNFSKKCENKICTFLADHPHKLFQAKFFASTSYKPKNLWLCEKCYKAYSSGNYCYYCHTVYREYEHGTQYYDRKKWIQCDYCQKWHHMQCEEKKGKYENIEELSLNTNFKYMCPFCRKDHESIMRQKHKNEKIKKNSLLNIKRKSNSNDHNEINKNCNKK
jgi:hypothetical protein